MADKLMYITNDNTPSVDYNQWLKELDTQHNEQNNQNNKVPNMKLLSLQIRKRYCKTLETITINRPLSPSIFNPLTSVAEYMNI